MHVGEKPFFGIRGNILKYGIPMLHSSEGKIKFNFFYKKAMFLSKNMKSGDDALGKSVANMNMAALMNEYDEYDAEEEGNNHDENNNNDGGELSYELPLMNVEVTDDRAGAVKRKNPFETQLPEKQVGGVSDDDIVEGADDYSEDSEHAIAEKKKKASVVTTTKKGTTKHQDKKFKK
jgi:hypothetical protein